MSLWVVGETITAARANAKSVFVGAAAPGTLYDGQIWYDTANKILKVYDNAGAVWLSLSSQSGTDTTAAGTKAVVYGIAFPATPKVFLQINDDTDGIIKLTATAAAGFTATVRILATASFINSVTSPTGNESAHTHGITSTSVANEVVGCSNDSCIGQAGADGKIHCIADAGQNFGVEASVILTVAANTGAGSAHSHSIPHSHADAVTGWTNGGAIGFNWAAVP